MSVFAAAWLIAACDDTTGTGGAGPSSGSTGTATHGSTSAVSGSSTSTSASAGTGGAPQDPCAGRLLCDDFEDDTIGQAPGAPWSVATNNGAVAIDGTHAHSGSRAVKVATGAGQYKQAFFATEGAPAFPIAGNIVYGRMMIYMDATANDGVHWTMIQGSGPLAGHDGVTSFYRYGGMWAGKMMANYETWGLSTDCWNNSEAVMPTGKWTCMEWKFDGPANDMHFWLDGKEISDLHVQDQGMGCGGHDLGDQWLAPTFEKMWLGWESYQNDDAREAWIDDVILDDAPIGCPP
ncbi:MAG: hypothetical protein U0414_34425 [Polyangiaceae bacterium]